MILREVIFEKLKHNQYEGLVNLEINCGCTLDDFMTCEGPLDNCQAGYVKKKGGVAKGYRPHHKPKNNNK